MFQILVVDDDKNIRRFLCAVLSNAGYRPIGAACAEDALKIMEEKRIDLIVLDVMMPGMDGYAFTKLLRDCRNDLPVLMLTAKQLPEDLKQGFLAGTDDYMTKPVNEEELLLRIGALLRRARIASDRQLTVGSTTLNFDSLTVSCRGETQLLPQKEFFLLYKLLSFPNHIFTRLQLMEEIWGPCTQSTDATISVHINRLRKRFENSPDFSIITIRGLGYKAQLKEGTP
ncbi:response regulator receiver domain protein [Marvinbryantia formatexigens DSM 14469]|uniref:Heme response regulator HssR n=1 Tax=Marvinbryantia formatexigens DSM 14469 TaxID=478749 RepID=C6LEC0_9FIRM|nr:response regulator transcription factor [Marvinbryantia formatexigens]EET60903.1 response regulator receiver domain protein [Marvinbryantia formatexigens DSM 14469]UWO24798.1 response regulator transcription factor [Marvinbryantia formatexigens DSM 14469]SDF23782.1 DNA-binding response regulator, OmpR family, contains REC and winged-helix (wHTH) domain [Marvinbryantia formatexigens]